MGTGPSWPHNPNIVRTEVVDPSHEERRRGRPKPTRIDGPHIGIAPGVQPRMTHATLLVHLQLATPNTAVLDVARRLADRLDAHVIGVAACQTMLIVSGSGYVCGDIYANDQRQAEVDLDAARAEFHDALSADRHSLEWRSQITLGPIADFLSIEARAADLIVVGTMAGDTTDGARAATAGALVMQAGRPILVVPGSVEPLRFDHALIAWKDTRESRRASRDALPLLTQFAKVTVVEIAAADALAEAEARVNDVVAWLGRHGVTGAGVVERSAGADVAELRALATRTEADLIVAGAYGHSRLREWAMGGVTRDLLHDTRRCTLLAH